MVVLFEIGTADITSASVSVPVGRVPLKIRCFSSTSPKVNFTLRLQEYIAGTNYSRDIRFVGIPSGRTVNVSKYVGGRPPNVVTVPSSNGEYSISIFTDSTASTGLLYYMNTN